MRAVLILVAVLIAGCAGEQLAELPPAGVDLSGKWRLNIADSDDPQRLGQALAAGPGNGTNDNGGQRSGRRGRGGGQGGSGQSGATPDSAGLPNAAPLPVSAVSEVLNWPGKDLEIKQLSGVAAFTSDGDNRVYQPGGAAKKRPGHGSKQICGWSGSSLIVMVDPDDDRPKFEEHYQLSSDGQRLVQLVLIKSGRMTGFSMSRVWDRVP
ncbi:MAG: hypothetical protein ABSF94_09165 [Steroidobacteraceae bacterium]|jgi:hypothetical protein